MKLIEFCLELTNGVQTARNLKLEPMIDRQLFREFSRIVQKVNQTLQAMKMELKQRKGEIKINYRHLRKKNP